MHIPVGTSFELDILAIIGLILMVVYLGSKGVQRLGAPQVVGFILVGVFLGPSFLNVVPESLNQELGFITEIALGLIGFEMGSHLRFDEVRRMGRSILVILFAQALATFLLVAGGVYLLTGSEPLALIFGALAVATAPAATVDVLAEYRAQGSLTTTLVAVVGMDDALTLLLFSLAAVGAESMLARTGGLTLVDVFILPLWEIGGALLLGLLIGLALDWTIDRFKERHAVCGFIVGVALFTTGLTRSLGISLILSLMTMGLVVTNRSADNSHYIRCLIERVGPLAYMLFFALIGARLQVSLLPQMGLLGLVYMALRAVGKFGGTWAGGWLGRADPLVRDNLGLALLSQAGVAIGLALTVADRFASYGAEGALLGQMVINVITGTTFVVQIIGPMLVKLAITRAGEAGVATPTTATVSDWGCPCPSE
jgi:NhaP-type Na+/H+ or K+/H+ antiporter